MVNDGTFSTADLWLGSFLRAKGMKIIRIEGEQRKVLFVFEDTQDREQLIKEFYNNGLIGITEIKNAVSDLKSAIFNMS